jgi:hypothetical protein
MPATSRYAMVVMGFPRNWQIYLALDSRPEHCARRKLLVVLEIPRLPLLEAPQERSNRRAERHRGRAMIHPSSLGTLTSSKHGSGSSCIWLPRLREVVGRRCPPADFRACQSTPPYVPSRRAVTTIDPALRAATTVACVDSVRPSSDPSPWLSSSTSGPHWRDR